MDGSYRSSIPKAFNPRPRATKGQDTAAPTSALQHWVARPQGLIETEKVTNMWWYMALSEHVSTKTKLKLHI